MSLWTKWNNLYDQVSADSNKGVPGSDALGLAMTFAMAIPLIIPLVIFIVLASQYPPFFLAIPVVLLALWARSIRGYFKNREKVLADD